MCYFLYGSINSEINKDDYKKAIKGSEYHFNIGDKNDVNTCVKNCGCEYRITSNHCDCDTPLGSKHSNKNGLKEFSELLINLRTIQGIKYVNISKNWIEELNEKETTVHIDDIDILNFLANFEDKILYKIELYKKYY